MDAVLIEDDFLLEKYNTIWDKVSADIQTEFDSESIYHKKIFKTKIESYGDLHDKEIPKVDRNHTCLVLMSLDSTLIKDGNYYPQVFLKECKYTEKEKKPLDTLMMIWGVVVILMILMKINEVEVSHLSLMRNGQGVFLSYLYDFKSQNISV